MSIIGRSIVDVESMDRSPDLASTSHVRTGGVYAATAVVAFTRARGDIYVGAGASASDQLGEGE
jgi:hypothetical protein